MLSVFKKTKKDLHSAYTTHAFILNVNLCLVCQPKCITWHCPEYINCYSLAHPSLEGNLYLDHVSPPPMLQL